MSIEQFYGNELQARLDEDEERILNQIRAREQSTIFHGKKPTLPRSQAQTDEEILSVIREKEKTGYRVGQVSQVMPPIAPGPRGELPSDLAVSHQMGMLPSGGIPGRVVRDIWRGVKESPKQIVGGARDFLDETGRSIEEAGDWLRNKTFVGGLIHGEAYPQAGPLNLPKVAEAETTTGSLIRSGSQFLAGFLPFAKVLKGFGVANIIIRDASAGAVTNFLGFDPHSERISNLINNLVPELKNPVTEYLAAKPADSEAEGKFKSALEGLALGLITDGIFHGVKSIRASRVATKAAKAAETAKAANQDVEAAVSKALDIEAKSVVTEPISGIVEPKPGVITPEVSELSQTGKVNLKYIDAEDTVKTVINEINLMQRASGEMEAATRGTISHGETIAASKGAMTIDQALAIQPGTVLNAEQMVGLRDLENSAAAALDQFRIRTLAGDPEAAKHLDTVVRIFGEIGLRRGGASAEIARSLESHKIPSFGPRADFHYSSVAELAESLKKNPIDDPMELAKRLSVLTTDGVIEMAKTVAKAGRWSNAFTEGWINGLLSGPQTHVANFVGNIATTFGAVAERGLSAQEIFGLGGRGVVHGEATQMVYGAINGFVDALRLAGKSFREGGAAISKLDFDVTKKAISGQNFNLTGPLGRVVDMLGTMVRLPGRALIASDEFFKAINYRMELHAQALRMATKEGKTGVELGKRIAEILADPPIRIQQAAENFKFYQTFQSELGPMGKAFTQLGQADLRGIPIGKFVLPFIKTPANIMKYVVERTPLEFLSNDFKRAYRAGGVQKDLALAKISLGSMILATAATLSRAGYITGNGPKDRNLRKQMMDEGWQPYSLHVGNKYYSFNRLDPLGMTLGLASSFVEIAGDLGEVDLWHIATSLALAVGQSVTSKNYLVGLSNVLEALNDPEQNAEKVGTDLARSLVPGIAATVEKAVDPVVREAWGIIENAQSRIPGLSSSLPPKRNLFGEPIHLSGSAGPDWLSPIYVSTRKGDPVGEEIIKQRVSIGSPPKVIGGKEMPSGPRAEKDRPIYGIELTHEEYDRFVVLAGKEFKIDGKGCHDYLEKFMQTEDFLRSSDGPDGTKAAMIRKIVGTFREAALEQLKEEYPNLRNALEDQKRKAIQAKMPKY
jgi:hypothetical protein